jgi:hypothetical protein
MTKSTPFKNSLATMTIAVCAVCSSMWRAEAATYFQTDPVSDISGLAAITDPEVQNTWGLTSAATSPFWIIPEKVTNDATLYGVTGSTNVSMVTAVNPPSGDVGIPTMGSDPEQWPIEAVTLSLVVAVASPTSEMLWRPPVMLSRTSAEVPPAPFHHPPLEVRWSLVILWCFLFWTLTRSWN